MTKIQSRQAQAQAQRGHNPNKEANRNRRGWPWPGANTIVLGLVVLVWIVQKPPSPSPSTSTSTAGQGQVDSTVSRKEWREFVIDYNRRFSTREGPPPGFKSWLAHAKQNQCSQREFYQSIHDDLEFYRSIIKVERKGQLLEKDEVIPEGRLNKKDGFYIAFQLKNHQLTVVAKQGMSNTDIVQIYNLFDAERNLRWMLEPLRIHQPPMDATYLFNLDDNPTPPDSIYPRFSVAKMAYWTNDQPPPTPGASFASLAALDNDNLQRLHQHNEETRDIMVPYHFGYAITHEKQTNNNNTKAKPFEQRNDQITWRGSTTGYPWGESPRFHLLDQYSARNAQPVRLNEQTPVMLDFAFVKVVQRPVHNSTAAPFPYTLGQKTSFSDMQQNKYIMDVDGNSFTERFPGLLKSGSVIFKSTRYKEWYTERLQPFVDYIPVNYDLTDLPEKLEWAHFHPTWAAKITNHAKNVATKHLRREDMRCYVYRLLLEYQTLFE